MVEGKSRREGVGEGREEGRGRRYSETAWPEAPKQRNSALAPDFLANCSGWCFAHLRVSSLGGHSGVVRVQSTECFSQELA
eukprot:7069038-Pyramimonas_sp.AAC.1